MHISKKVYKYKGKDLSYQIIESKKESNNFLLLHGWGQSSCMWSDLPKRLLKLGNIYLLDLPGFGESDYFERSIGVKEFTEIVYSFIKDLGLKDLTVISHSFSCRIALCLTRLVQMEGLVLIGPNPSRWSRLKLLFFYSFYLFPKAFYWISCKLFHPRQYKNKYRNDRKLAKSMLKTFIKTHNEDNTEGLSQFPKKTVIIHGEKDRIVNIKNGYRLARKLERKIFKIQDAGHFPHIQNKDEFIESLVNARILTRC